MSCGNSCNKKVTECPKKEINECCGNTNPNTGSSAFVIIIVLYILLAIIVGSDII